MEDALTLVLLGIAACFMPLVFGLEITMLGSNNGAQKSSGLVGGVTLFRVLLAIGITLLFAVGVADVAQEIVDSTSSLKSAISQFRQDVTSGERIILDMLLFASGILLIVNAFRHIRGTSEGDESTDADSAETRDSKAIETGVVGMLGIGLFMAVTNVNQWVFMTAGVSQILAMHESATKRLLAFIVFLLVSSLMIALPLVVVLVRPQQAQGILGKVNRWIDGSLKYVVAIVMFGIGLYFIARGVAGIVQYFNA